MTQTSKVLLLALIGLGVVVALIFLLRSRAPQYEPQKTKVVREVIPPTSTPPPTARVRDLGTQLPATFPKELILPESTLLNVKQVLPYTKENQINVELILNASGSAIQKRYLELLLLEENEWQVLSNSINLNTYVLFAAKDISRVQISIPAQESGSVKVRIVHTTQ